MFEKFKLLFFCSLWFGITLGQPGPPSPRYVMITQNQTYFGAYFTCKQFGYELVSIESSAEWNEIFMLLQESEYHNKTDGNYFWTSGNSLQEEGSKKFHWMSNGQPVKSSTFERNGYSRYLVVPTVGSNENCLSIAKRGELGIHYTPCDYQMGYICEDPRNRPYY